MQYSDQFSDPLCENQPYARGALGWFSQRGFPSYEIRISAIFFVIHFISIC